MDNFKNENAPDRLIRLILGEIFLLFAFFWLGGIWQVVLYVLAAVMLFTGVTGFCALYKIFKIDTTKSFPNPAGKTSKYILPAIIVLLPFIGGYYSNFFTRKIFLEDYNRMNNYYKQTLFNTGQDKRVESIKNYESLKVEFANFQNKYSAYHPFVIKYDGKFNSDLAAVAENIHAADQEVREGDLKQLHTKFEAIRPIFQDILKRNGFSMLAVSLVDFHDAMEKVIAASDNKSPEGVITTYADADEKLKLVESEANDDEIKAIRTNLDALLDLAKNGKATELSKKAAELKSSFVKVYLKRG